MLVGAPVWVVIWLHSTSPAVGCPPPLQGAVEVGRRRRELRAPRQAMTHALATTAAAGVPTVMLACRRRAAVRRAGRRGCRLGKGGRCGQGVATRAVPLPPSLQVWIRITKEIYSEGGYLDPRAGEAENGCAAAATTARGHDGRLWGTCGVRLLASLVPVCGEGPGRTPCAHVVGPLPPASRTPDSWFASGANGAARSRRPAVQHAVVPLRPSVVHPSLHRKQRRPSGGRSRFLPCDG